MDKNQRFCMKCGKKVPLTDKFCDRCGTPVVEVVEATRVCTTCGSGLSDADQFCPNCGRPAALMPKVCPDCGAVLGDKDMFCQACGKSLAEETAAEAAPVISMVGEKKGLKSTFSKDAKPVSRRTDLTSNLTPEESGFKRAEDL